MMSRECAVKKEALSCCQATMSAIKTVDEKLTSHIRYLYFVSGGSNQQQGREPLAQTGFDLRYLLDMAL